MDSFIANSSLPHAAAQGIFTSTLKCMGMVLVSCELDSQNLGDIDVASKFNWLVNHPNASRRIDW